MGRKLPYYQISNIPNEDEFIIIYNHVIDGMYILEKVFKKTTKLENLIFPNTGNINLKMGLQLFLSQII